MSESTKRWTFPMPPRTDSERERFEAEQQRRRDLQANAITGITAEDMPGVGAICAFAVGGLVTSWLQGGAS